jgi:regulatory protein
MPTITRIAELKRTPNRRSIHLDGRFAFAVNLNVVARFSLLVGKQLTDAQVEQIGLAEQRQRCFDHALRVLSHRAIGRSELRRRLLRSNKWDEPIIDDVLDGLERLDYLNDARMARQSAETSAQRKRHGRNRALADLLKRGVDCETARHAVEKTYEATDSLALARELARKQLARLQRLPPEVARRRLFGVLLRRGHDYETARPVVDELLGYHDAEGVIDE